MTKPKTHEPCPCNSGLTYEHCCGFANRNALNVETVARLTATSIETSGKLTVQMDAALESFATNPELFPARINFFQQKAWFVKMSPRWYRESVFLDPARIQGTCVVEIELERLQQMTQDIIWQPSAFIFHTAFCGSTLMTKALDAIFDCLPLREPEVLGNLLTYTNSQEIEQEDPAWLDRILRLLCRRYKPDQTTVIKANDHSNPLMVKLLECPHDIPVLFMYTSLDEFVVACLKENNRCEWVRSRYKHVSAHLPSTLTLPAGGLSIDDDDYAQMAAVYWCFNIALYQQAWQRYPDKLRSLDINIMLAQPRKSVEACGHLFGLKLLDDIDVDKKINNLLGVYSKNNQLNYSPQQRIDDVAKLLAKYKTEIETAEQLAQQLLLAHKHPDDQLPGHLI